MAASRYFLLAAVIGVLGSGLLLLQCAPEELVYKPSGGAGGDGSAGDGPIGVGGTNTWAEICGNGIDDDHNGKTDCEDPACSSYACVDLPPSGWSGPVALYQGASGSVASCPKGLSDVYDGNADPSYAPAQCGACSCGSPSGGGCSVDVTYFSDTACSVGAGSASVGTGAGCGAANAGTVGSVTVGISSSAGSCGAGTGGTPTLAPPSWKAAARACALGSGTGNPAGCANGKVCAPLSSDSLACVYQTGDVACPAGYPARHVYYSSFDDTRSCGACGCSYADDGCNTTVTGYAGTDCTSAVLSNPGAGCLVAAPHSFTASGGPANPRCDPGTAAPSGCVAPATPTTLCCSGYAGTPCPSAHGPAMVQVTAGSTAYCIDSTEVTKAQYQEFLATNPSLGNQPATCTQWNTTFSPGGFGPTGPADSPVTYVDWCDAYAYCAWAGKRLCGKIGGGTLAVSAADDASQSQWYDACTAGGTRKYPYGNEAISGACGPSTTLKAVKSYPCCQGGVAGLYDMVGTAEEWIDSCQTQSTKGDHDQCLTESGSSCAANGNAPRNRHDGSLGFRCCAP